MYLHQYVSQSPGHRDARSLAVVNVEHEGVGALDEDLVVAVLGLLHVLDGVDDVRGELGAVLLEAGNLLLDVVLEQVAKALLIARRELAQLALKELLVEDLVDANTTPLDATQKVSPCPMFTARRACSRRVAYPGLCAVRRANAAPRGANLALAQLHLLETVDGGVEVKVDLAAVRDEDAVVDVGQALGLEFAELLEEARDVEDDAGADEVHAVRVDEAGGEEVEAVRHAVGDCGKQSQSTLPSFPLDCWSVGITDRVSGIVAAGSPGADLRLGAENVSELSYAMC